MSKILSFVFDMIVHIFNTINQLSWSVILSDGSMIVIQWGWILVAFSVLCILFNSIWRGIPR